MAESKCSEWKPVFAMVGVSTAFAIMSILLEKVLHEGMSHLVLVTYRQSIATIFIAPIAYIIERKTRPVLTVGIFWQIFVSALLGATFSQYLFLLGIGYTSATFFCAFTNLLPVTTFLMALPFGLETANLKSNAGRAKVLGTAICVGGAMVLTLYRGKTLTKTSHSISKNHLSQHHRPVSVEKWALGSAALVGGCLCWSSWMLLQAKVGKRYPAFYSNTAIMTFLSAIQSAILSFVVHRETSSWALQGKFQIITVVYAGMVGSGLCFVVMSWCVKKRGPVFIAAFSPVTQIIVAFIDFLILRHPLHLGSVLGSVPVIAGLYILLWGKNMEAQECAAKQVQTIDVGENQLEQP